MYYFSDIFDRFIDDFFRGVWHPNRFEQIPQDRLTSFPTTPPPRLTVCKDGTAILELAVIGRGKDDIEISVENRILYISSKKKETEGKKEIEEKKYPDDSKVLINKISEGSFSNSYKFPNEYDLEAADITLEHGLLTVKVPMKEKEKIERKLLEIK